MKKRLALLCAVPLLCRGACEEEQNKIELQQAMIASLEDQIQLLQNSCALEKTALKLDGMQTDMRIAGSIPPPPPPPPAVPGKRPAPAPSPTPTVAPTNLADALLAQIRGGATLRKVADVAEKQTEKIEEESDSFMTELSSVLGKKRTGKSIDEILAERKTMDPALVREAQKVASAQTALKKRGTAAISTFSKEKVDSQRQVSELEKALAERRKRMGE